MIINLSKINSLKMLIIMIIIIFLFSQNNYNIFAAELSTPEDRVEKSSNLEIDFNSIVSYDSYLNIYRDLTHPEANYTIDILDYKKSDDAVITTESF